MGKAPASQFYWGDWRRDPGIRACSFETRGIWFEMLCLMWESENKGFFILNGLPPDDLTASRMIGCTPEQYQSAVTELEVNNVMSRNCHACKQYQNSVKLCDMSQNVTFQSRQCHGIIFNRRMVKEEKEKQGFRERQARHRKLAVTQASQSSHKEVTPLSSSSSSSSLYINNNSKLENSQTIAPAKPEHPKSDYSTPPQKDLEFIEHDDGSVEILNPKAIIPKGKWYKNQIGNFVCSICQKEYSFYESLQEHLATH